MNNLDTYSRNPVYRLEVCGPKDDDNEFLIKLKGPKQVSFLHFKTQIICPGNSIQLLFFRINREYAIGMDLHAITIRDSNSPNFFHRKSCDVYRQGRKKRKYKQIIC